jgi:hypothetical protein
VIVRNYRLPARRAGRRVLGATVWASFGAAGGLLAVETVGWVLDPLMVLALWRLSSGSRARDQLMAAYAVGYLVVASHVLVPHLYAAWPSLADRVYCAFLLLVGATLLLGSAGHAGWARIHPVTSTAQPG